MSVQIGAKVGSLPSDSEAARRMLNRPNVGLTYVKSMDFPSYILMIEWLLCTKKHAKTKVKRYIHDTWPGNKVFERNV